MTVDTAFRALPGVIRGYRESFHVGLAPSLEIKLSGGNRFTQLGTGGSFGKALSRAGIKDFHFHDLRHTFATDMISAGVDIFTLSKFLGRTDPKITARVYAHLSPEYRRTEMAKYEAYLEKSTNRAQQRTFMLSGDPGLGQDEGNAKAERGAGRRDEFWRQRSLSEA